MMKVENMEVLASPPRKKNKTINNRYIKRLQQWHAWSVNLFGFSGFAIAIALLISGYSISGVEVGIFAGMWLVTMVGLVVGYHRHFTHRSFQAATPVRVLLAIFGSMTGQGNVMFWTSLHRFHHEYSDRPGDPHSPYFQGEKSLGGIRGLWHSYVGWTTNHDVPNPNHYAVDILRDPVISKVSKLYFVWVFLGLAIPTIIGGIILQSWTGALSGFLWGGAVRMGVTHNLVWSITSIAHIIGTRDLESGDRSTNNFWIAIPTLGDSWHNNHHTFPNAAVVGWQWWQIDIAGWIIRGLEMLGLAWDVKVPTAKAIEAKQL